MLGVMTAVSAVLSIIYLSLICVSMSAPAVKIATENVETRGKEMRRVTAE